ncbi:uncharacterized protein LOC119736533 [Patiria miniata]|uniref:TERF1-interacting nuclear factor 2 N-terminal domain-containing protein n=1 Tax=Patiria miniata TaxID=46514 RepID=A0A914AS43_PATMI|nr:uncharacterized protein LOC119736533 [Patiria miniata]
MAVYRCPKRSTEKDRETVEELILDYACKNYMDHVIAAIVDHQGNASFKENDVPHLRVVAGTLHSIVKREDIAEFDHALLLLDIINKAAPDLVPAKQFVKLTTGIKTKVMLHELLQSKFDYCNVCARLNRYFPKAELKTTGVSKEDFKLHSYQLRYRRLLTRLMLSASEREAYLRNEMDAELGPAYTAAIQRLLRYYVDRLNERLSVPVIEQIVSEGPDSQISHDIMDSQSDYMDKLLAISFCNPPTEDQLLTILKECWKEEEERDTEDKMEMSDGDDDDDWQSASDIFDFPAPPNNPSKTSNISSRLSDPQGRLSLPQDIRGSAPHAAHCESGPNDEPARDKKGSSDAEASQFADCLVVDCPSKTSLHPVGVHRKPPPSKSPDPTDDIKDAVCSVTLAEAASSTRAGFSETDFSQRPEAWDQQQIIGSAPRELEVLPERLPNLETPGTSQILPESSALKSVLKSALSQSLEASDQQQIGRCSPKELKSLPNGLPTRETTGISDVLPELSVHQETDLMSNASRQNYFTANETESLSFQTHSSGTEAPQPSYQADSSFPNQEATLIGSSGAKTVSKSRIYLSKSGLQSRSQWKQVQYENADSCLDPTEVKTSKHCEVIKGYKACIKRNATQSRNGQEIGESQINVSSDESQSSSDKSSTSVSLLAGLCGFDHAPKRPRSDSPVMTIIQDDEIMGLTSFSPFEDTVISDIEVYPVTRLKHGVDIGSIRSTSTRNCELSTIQETPQHSEAVSTAASQLAAQDNTVSSSNNTLSLDSNSAGQSQPEEVRVEEVVGHKEILETEETSCQDAGDSRRTVSEELLSPRFVVCEIEPAATVDDESSGSCVQDVTEVPTPKRICSKKAVVKLKRLSQDSKVRRYLESSTLSEAIMSSDDVNESSDSEDSFVPDSDNEDSASTSDSSSLPCIELRPDSECQLVRRFPSLMEYLQESSEEDGMTKDHRMRECTVRLRRLKPTEIDAFTKGKCNINLGRTSVNSKRSAKM